jgi:hypothetical protein
MIPASGVTGLPVGPTSGGKVYAFNNVGTSPEVVAPINTARTSITFDNPGAVDIIVFPVNVQALNSVPANISPNQVGSISNQPLSPTTSALGGGFRIFGNGGSRTFGGECQGAWQALSVEGSNNPFTVTDSNT